MKNLIQIFQSISYMLLFSLVATSQKASKLDVNANAGISVFGTRNVESTIGAFIGFGIKTGPITSGFSADIFQFEKDKLKYVILSGDFKAYILGLEKTVNPFFSAQPGFVLYNKTVSGIKMKGSFAYAANMGVWLKPQNKIPGVVISLGYQNISFKVYQPGILPYPKIQRSSGIKINVGISI